MADYATLMSGGDIITNIERTAMMVSGRINLTYDPKYFVTQNQFGDSRDWRIWAARRSRYAIQWSHYEGTVYDQINIWAEGMKEDRSLYEFIRSIYSPAHRLGEFWATHIFGGTLDPNAGDGSLVPSAMPIICDNDDLRKAIARLWKNSQWQVHKETIGRFGAIMGDVAAVVEDDPDRGLVRMRVIDPRIIFDVDEDSLGNVRGYVLCEMRPDPRLDLMVQSGSIPVPYVLYKEICRRQGENVIFETFLDNIPWDWNDPDRNGRASRGPIWMESYGFVPMVRIQHKDIGCNWGMSEFFGLLPKLYELDDQASKFGDYVRRAVDCPWLMCGINADDVSSGPNQNAYQPGDTPDEGRQRVPIIYTSEPNAKAQALIAPLNLHDVLSNISSILQVIEREHPELMIDAASASGDASGRALRVAREKAEALVNQRRAVYDDAMRRLMQQAISIGIQQGYDGYRGFSQDAYERGELDFAIGTRPVFSLNESDRIEIELERGKIIELMVKSGVPLVTALQRAGYRKDMIADMSKEREKEMQLKLQEVMTLQIESATTGLATVLTNSSKNLDRVSCGGFSVLSDYH